MAGNKRRKVVQDIQETKLTATTSSANPRVASLQTRSGDNASAKIIKSFGDFSRTFQELGTNIEKNLAADEAVEARNTALAGQYQPFDRPESIEIYNTTVGDIKGKSAGIALEPQFEQLMKHHINQNHPDPKTAIDAYTKDANQLLKDQHGDLFDENTDDSYRAGFFGQVIPVLNKGSSTFGAAWKTDWDAKTKTVHAETILTRLRETKLVPSFDPLNPNSAGRIDEESVGLQPAGFKGLVQEGINLGMSKPEATLSALEAIGKEVAHTGQTGYFNFFDRTKSDGLMLSSNPEYRKIHDRDLKLGTAVRTAASKERRANEKYRVAQKRDISSSKFHVFAHQNPRDPGLLDIMYEVGTANNWTPAMYNTASDFVEALADGDELIIALDMELEDELTKSIYDGSITTPSELNRLFTMSRHLQSGINREALGRLQQVLEDVKKEGAEGNAYKRNLEFLKTSLGFDKNFVLTERSGETDFITRREVSAGKVRTYKEAFRFFKAKFPLEPLNGEKANEFFGEVIETITEAGKPDPEQTNPGKEQPKEGESEIDKRDRIINENLEAFEAHNDAKSKVKFLNRWTRGN